MPRSYAARETNVTHVLDRAEPYAPNIGRYIVGCGVGSEALGSPILAQLIIPPLITILGFAPKKARSHNTKSASLPGEIEPRTCPTPCVTAGLIVNFAT